MRKGEGKGRYRDREREREGGWEEPRNEGGGRGEENVGKRVGYRNEERGSDRNG